MLTDQYLDRTHGRADTFYDEGSVQHLPARPTRSARTCSAIAAAALGDAVVRTRHRRRHPGTAVLDPRRVAWFRAAGAHLVNMTLYPEVPLAAELGIGTVTLAFVTDNDAGARPTRPLSAELVFARLADAQPRIVAAIEAIVAAIPDDYAPRELIARGEVAAVLARPAR